jgi:hypothetical protein
MRKKYLERAGNVIGLNWNGPPPVFAAFCAVMLVGTMGSRVFSEEAPMVDSPAASETTSPVILLGDDAAEYLAAGQDGLWTSAATQDSAWTIDCRFRTLCNSKTTSENGTTTPPPTGWAPLSRLNYSLDSCWYGLRVGVERPNWGVHCEWLTPQQNIQGTMADYDWMTKDQSFTDLGYMQERWTEGQMLDLGGEFKLTDRFCGVSVELWPMAGFRWQQFDIMCYDLNQVKSSTSDPYRIDGNIISFNQQYYVTYLGGQLRKTFEFNWLPPIVVTFQGDWGYASAYNIDHHLRREGDMFTMDSTYGDSWHVGLTTEMLFNKHWSVGFQADYTQIHTCGTTHYVNEPLGQNFTYSNGVADYSNQMMLTAFIRLRI